MNISRRTLGISVAALGITAAAGQSAAAADTSNPKSSLGASYLRSGGTYPEHLQGICTNNSDSIYWSWSNVFTRTDLSGRVLRKLSLPTAHLGSPCYNDGKVYVPVNFGVFDDPNGNADNWIYVYDSVSLSLLSTHPAPEVIYGAGGIAFDGERFIVVGGLPNGDAFTQNFVYEYDGNLDFVAEHTLNTGHTTLGIQTAAYNSGNWWFGCYDEVLLKVAEDLSTFERFENFECAVGLTPVSDTRFWVARMQSWWTAADKSDIQYVGEVVLAETNPQLGLHVINSSVEGQY